MGQSRMDNTEKLATLGIQDTGRRQSNQKTQQMSKSDLTKARSEPIIVCALMISFDGSLPHDLRKL